MTDAPDPLITAALRPLSGDAESRSSARMLLETLREEHTDQAQDALKRWDAHDKKKRRLSWRAVFMILAAVISAVMLTPGMLDFMDYRRILRAASGYEFDDAAKVFDLTRFTTRDKQLLKISDAGQSPLELAKVLWESDPANAAYFCDYCATYFSDNHETLPPDFLAQAGRIAPDNAFFPYWAAGVEAKDAAKIRSLSKAARASGAAPEWDVIDESKIDRALAILRGSNDLPDHESYEIQLMRERIPLLPQANPSEYHSAVSYLAMTTSVPSFSRALPNAIAAKAWLFGERGDAGGLLALKADADAYLRNISRSEPGFLIQDIIIESRAKSILKNLTASAKKLGLVAEAAEAQGKLDRLDKLTTDREAVMFEIDGKDARQKLSAFKRYSMSYLSKRTLHPPMLRDSDVKPGRMTEHEILAQLCTHATWALLGIASGLAALYRLRSPRLVRSLAARMELLLRPADWAWLFVAGIPPFVYLMLITRFTDLGGSELNILSLFIELPYYDGLPLPLAQFVGMFLMTLILPVLVARWRIGKRAAFFGFGKTRLWAGGLAFISAAAFIPVLGWAVTTGSDTGLKIAWALFVIPLGWILAVVIRAMTTGMGQLLHLNTVSRILVPTYLAAAVVLLLATPYFKWSRQHWFEQDPMARLDVNYPSLTKFEYEISVAARKEVREALGYE